MGTQVKTIARCCRICVSYNGVGCRIYEPINGHEGKTSLHMMLAKLFPSFFNEEQVKRDEAEKWPQQICEDCGHMVMEAYRLYELCVLSASSLKKTLTIECMSASEHDSEPEKLFLSSSPASARMETEQVPEKLVINRGPSIETSGWELAGSDEVPEMLVNTRVLEIPARRTSRMRRARTKHGEDSVLKYVKEEATLEKSPFRNVDGIVEREQEEWLTSRECKNSISAKKRKSRPSRNKTKSNAETKNNTLENMPSTDMDQLAVSKTKIDLYRCQLCDGATYTAPTDLTEHLKTLHPDQIRSCEQCPKVFMNEQSFQHHQYCHATGRSFFCMYCDKGFQKQSLLHSHTQTHTKRGDFLCSLCGKEFTNHTNLRQHTKIKHSGEKPWSCTLCPSRFTTKGSLKMHQYTHTKIKKFSCETCGTQFTKHSSLVKHRLIHTGERPFVCEVCKMRFVSNYMLKRHMLTHTGEKPHKCTYCERSFAQSNDMVKHIRTHVGDNLYKCDRCDASYRLLSELRNHYTDHYQSGDGIVSSVNEEKNNIRFTTAYIMELRVEKEKAENSRLSDFSTKN